MIHKMYILQKVAPGYKNCFSGFQPTTHNNNGNYWLFMMYQTHNLQQ
jgi:hypothetical protein